MRHTLEDLGWRPSFNAQILEDAGAGCHPEVGDWLLVDDVTLEVRRVLQRENLFKRQAPGTDKKTQLIAANVHTLFIVASCNKDFSTARLERYLVLAQEVGVQPVVILTKTDLTDTPDIFSAAVRDLRPELLIEAVNGRDPVSVARLATWCGRGQTVALVGSSGDGKSTLVNSLRGSDRIMTQAIRKGDDTGRHTTTVREMHRLAGGGWLLDTPGMRELQLTDVGSGIAEIFDNFVATSEHCRFSNCTHEVEPGCAVRAAIADGRLSAARLDRIEAAEVIRSLIDAIIVVPEDGELKIDVRGDLAGILSIAVERKKPASRAGISKAATPGGVSQFPLVAGARNHLKLQSHRYNSVNEHRIATMNRHLKSFDFSALLYCAAA